MRHVQERRIKLFHTKKHDFDLTVIPSTIGVSWQKALDNIKSVIFEPSNLSSKITSSILVRSTGIIVSSIPEGTNTFFRPTSFTSDILLRMNPDVHPLI